MSIGIGRLAKLVGVAMVAVVLGVSCNPHFVKLDKFQDDPTFREQFIGTWRSDVDENGSYSVQVINEDGTAVATFYSKDGDAMIALNARYKTSSNQIMFVAMGRDSGVPSNYSFLNNDTFTMSNSLGTRTYHRVLGAVQESSNIESNTTSNVTSNTTTNTTVGIEGALERAVNEVAETFDAQTRLAIVYITADDRSVMQYITGELEHLLRRRGFVIVDRSELDRVRAEQMFGMSGEVDDNTAARIGNIAGANIVITGRVDGDGDLRRLRLRALNTTSAQVVGTASERF